MSTTYTTGRLALLPVQERSTERPAIRRYKLGRVVDPIGHALAAQQAVAQAPAQAVRAP